MCVCVLKRNGARARAPSPVPTTARTQPQMGGGVDPVSARGQAESARTCTSSATAGSIHTGRSGPLYTLGVRLILSGQTELTDPFARNIDSCMELGCGEDWPPPMAALWELRLPCGSVAEFRSLVRCRCGLRTDHCSACAGDSSLLNVVILISILFSSLGLY